MLACVGAVVLCGTPAARAQTQTYALPATTYIDQGYPADNFGAKTQMEIVADGPGGSHGLTVGRSLVAIPSFTTPVGDVIQSVQLELYCTAYMSQDTSASYSAALYPLMQSFNQGSSNKSPDPVGSSWNCVTGTTPWSSSSTVGGNYDSSWTTGPTLALAPSSWTSFNLTSLWTNPSLATQLQELQAYGAEMLLSPESPSSMPASSYAEYEFAGNAWTPPSTYQPYLAVTFAAAPEPSTLALLAAGASLAAIGFGRRRRARRRRPTLAGPAG